MAVIAKSLTGRLGEDVADLVDFVLSEVTGSSVRVNLSNFACEGGKPSADTLNNAEGEGHLMFSVDIGVHHTQKVLECTSLSKYESRV